MKELELIHANCMDALSKLPRRSVDAVVTDPPYGLSFMGKKWDYNVPKKELWEAVFRVLRPGGHMLAFGGTCTYHRMVVNIEDAGFNIRDQLQWLYGSGFPKSHNLPNGIGTALKPANEPIVLARKPFSEKTAGENVEKWGVGGLNIDVSRITTDADEQKKMLRTKGTYIRGFLIGAKGGFTPTPPSPLGRWPANLLLDEEAARMLDEQSGMLKSGALNAGHKQHQGLGGRYKTSGVIQHNYGNDSGGASRFFYVAKASKRERNAGLEGMPKKFIATMSDGIGDREYNENEPSAHNANHHPTVKPIKLMEYLIKLITPPGGIVLDPFMGSGTTGIAALMNGFKFIGMEINKQYFEIAEKRIHDCRKT